MANEISWLIVPVMLTAFFPQCHCQCDAYSLENTQSVTKCNELYNTLESALVTPENLYVIRDAFFTSFERSPTLLMVTYKLWISNSTENITHQLDLELGWSSTPLFASLNPLSLLAFQSLPYLEIFQSENVGILPKNITLSLYMENSTRVHDAQVDDFLYVLKQLTTKLKAVARENGRLNTWDSRDRGYLWNIIAPPHYEMEALFLAFTCLGIVISVFSVAPALMLYSEIGKGNEMLAGLVWGTTVVAMIFNCIVVLLEVQLLSILSIFWAFVLVTKFFSLFVILLVSLCWSSNMVGVAFKHKSHTVAPCLRLVSKLLCCTCFCGERLRAKFLHWLALFNMMVFILFVIRESIPALLLMMVYPVTVLSVILVSILYLSSFIIAISTGIHFCDQLIASCRNGYKPNKKKAVAVFVCILVILGIYPLLLSASLYLKLLAKSGDSGDVLSELLRALLPSLAVALLGYLFKRFVWGKRNAAAAEDKMDNADRKKSESQTELLQLAEEGQASVNNNEGDCKEIELTSLAAEDSTTNEHVHTQGSSEEIQAEVHL